MNKMRKAKELKPEELLLLKELCIQDWKAKEDKETICRRYHCSLSALNRWIKSYKTFGKEGLKVKQVGRKPGTGYPLNKWQENYIKKCIATKRPKDLGVGDELWERKEVQQLIEKQYKIKRDLSTIGRWLGKWGFTSQKPKKRSYKQDDTQVENFKELVKKKKRT